MNVEKWRSFFLLFFFKKSQSIQFSPTIFYFKHIFGIECILIDIFSLLFFSHVFSSICLLGRMKKKNNNLALDSVQTQPDVVYIQTQHPLIGLINSIGFKISNTADFFAGMLRGTIQVIKKKKTLATLSQRKQYASNRKVSAHQIKRKQNFNHKKFISSAH